MLARSISTVKFCVLYTVHQMTKQCLNYANQNPIQDNIYGYFCNKQSVIEHIFPLLVLSKAKNKALATSKFNTVVFTTTFSHISQQLSKCKGQMGRSPSISIKQCKWETSLWLFKQNSSKTSACFQAKICNISLV